MRFCTLPVLQLQPPAATPQSRCCDAATTERPRNAALFLACSDPGYFSAEGDAQCTLCPLGQYNPLPGLPDQSGITGFNCIKCAEGSMPLSAGKEDPNTTPLGAGTGATPAEGATFCDAW